MRRVSNIQIGLVMLVSLSAAARGLGAVTPFPLTLVDPVISPTHPGFYSAYYTQPTGLEMIGPYGLSSDAGRTWSSFAPTPDFSVGLPYGYQRNPFPGVVDPISGRIVMLFNALDTPGLDPNEIEPPIAEKAYYLRYSVSTDAGRTRLFNETVVQNGYTEPNPFAGVYTGQNGIYLGDIGSTPIFTSSGNILVGAQVGLLDANGELTYPGGTVTSYTDVVPIVGTWGQNNRLNWSVSQRVAADPARSTRGMIEPTMAEMPDGRILMVMRGSNGGSLDPNFDIPSYKWSSVSSDGGHTWTEPEPWTYDTGEAFFSPSSMSSLVKMSNGRVFWTGNINPTNSAANDARWPLVLGEVDPITLKLKKNTLQTVDTFKPGDSAAPSQLNIGHVRAIEDRLTGDLLLGVLRTNDGYDTTVMNTYRYSGVNQFRSTTTLDTTNAEDANLRITNNYNDNNGDMFVGESGTLIMLLRFDLPLLPDGAVVDNAKLQFYVTQANTPLDVSAHALLRNWDEATVDWSNYSTGNNWTILGGQGAGTDHKAAEAGLLAISELGYTDMDITAQYQLWQTGAESNYGLILISPSDVAGFNRIGDINGGFNPMLVVDYHVVPEPASLAMLGLSGLVTMRRRS
jgi:hypothetical protein